jgi:hypothetical protein
MEETALSLNELLLFCIVVIMACLFVVVWAYSTRERDDEAMKAHRRYIERVDKDIRRTNKILDKYRDEKRAWLLEKEEGPRGDRDWSG